MDLGGLMRTGSYYLNENGFIFNKFVGNVDDTKLLKLITYVNDKTGDVADLREFSDCRKVENIDEMTVEGTISNSKEEVNRPESLLAILVPELDRQIYGMAEVYKSYSEGTRKDVKIFTDFEEALSWLAPDAAEREVLTEFIASKLLL